MRLSMRATGRLGLGVLLALAMLGCGVPIFIGTNTPAGPFNGVHTGPTAVIGMR